MSSAMSCFSIIFCVWHVRYRALTLLSEKLCSLWVNLWVRLLYLINFKQSSVLVASWRLLFSHLSVQRCILLLNMAQSVLLTMISVLSLCTAIKFWTGCIQQNKYIFSYCFVSFVQLQLQLDDWFWIHWSHISGEMLSYFQMYLRTPAGINLAIN